MITAVIILCYVVGLGCAFTIGCGVTRVRILDRVFSPWLHSISPGSADFWLRSRDWGAAYDAFNASEIFTRTPRGGLREFTDSPDVLAAITASEVDRMLRAASTERSK